MLIEKRPPRKKKKKKVLYYKYGCPNGHMRTEKSKLGDSLPYCTTCHMTKGEYVKLKYIGEKKG